MKKFGLMDPFYFDLMLFLKENHFFSDDKYLLYNFDCISILNESIDSGLIDIALTDKSLLYESDNVGLLSNFMDTPYRLVGVSNFYEKLKDKDHILKVALPIKSNPFKLMIMNFLKSYQARNVKIQWIKYNCSNIEKLFIYCSTSSTIRCTSNGKLDMLLIYSLYSSIFSVVLFFTNFPSITSI